MEKKIFLYGGILLLAVVLVLFFGTDFVNKKQENIQANNQQIKTDQDISTYKRSDGTSWSIPKGEAKIQVSSNPKEYPRFVSGVIDPLDIAVGMTQTTKVVIYDSVPLKSVIMKISHDKGVDEIPMKLIETKQITKNVFKDRKFLVDENGSLVFNNNKNSNSFASLIKNLFNKAKADGAVAYTYEGKWVAHDTHTTKYETIVYATDALNRKNKLALGWSDPCNVSALGYLGFDCNLTEVWGFDGGDLDMNSNQITLGSGGKLVYNSGKSIKITGTAKINNINSGAIITQGYLYYPDADGDKYTATTTLSYYSVSTKSGYVRKNAVLGQKSTTDAQQPETSGTAGLDCYDSGTNAVYAHPGQLKAYYTSRGDGSFDYNCDGSTTGGWHVTTGPVNWQSVLTTMFGYDPSNSMCITNTWDLNSDGCGISYSTSGGCLVVQKNKNIFDKLISIVLPVAKALPNGTEGWYSDGTCRTCLSGTIYTLCR